MNLLTKIRGMFISADNDMPEIIEDMYVRPTASPNETFYAELDMIVVERNISYFDAFVVHITEDADIYFENRSVLRNYLYNQELADEDVKNLIDEFYRVVMPDGPNDLG